MTTLGKYELHEQLGKGSFGTVYRATDLSLDRVVALKVLHPLLSMNADFIERFRNEAKLAAALKSPHVLTIYEVGEERGSYYIVMDYYPGGSLADLLKAGPLSWNRAVDILSQVCEGLQKLHEKGGVHRDLKPSNILFDAEGRAVVADFGQARALTGSGSSSSGIGAGTPFYRAPELWNGKPPASPATDVYSLGCILGEMLTGKPLFAGDTPEEVLTRHLVHGPDFGEGWPPPGAPGAAQVLIDLALQKDSQSRPEHARAFAQLLAEATSDSPPPVVVETPESVPAVPEEPLPLQVGSGPDNSEQPQPEGPSSHFRLPRWGLGTAAILILLIGAAVIFSNFPPAAPAPRNTATVPSSTAAPETTLATQSPEPTSSPSAVPSPTVTPVPTLPTREPISFENIDRLEKLHEFPNATYGLLSLSETIYSFITTERTIEVWDVSRNQKIQTFTYHWNIYDISADDKVIVFYDGDRVEIAEISTGNSLKTLIKSDSTWVSSSRIPGSAIIYKSNNQPNKWIEVNYETLTENSIPVPEGTDQIVPSADGKLLAAHANGTIHILERSSGKEIQSIPLNLEFTKINFTFDNQTIMAYYQASYVKAWEIASGEEFMDYRGNWVHAFPSPVSPFISIHLEYEGQTDEVNIWFDYQNKKEACLTGGRSTHALLPVGDGSILAWENYVKSEHSTIFLRPTGDGCTNVTEQYGLETIASNESIILGDFPGEYFRVLDANSLEMILKMPDGGNWTTSGFKLSPQGRLIYNDRIFYGIPVP